MRINNTKIDTAATITTSTTSTSISKIHITTITNANDSNHNIFNNRMEDTSSQLSHQNGQLGSSGGGGNGSAGGNISGVNNNNNNNTSQLGGGGGNNISGGGLNNNKTTGDGGIIQGNTATSHEQVYTIPGVLHFIQHEFSRFEIERSQWDVDRAELQVKNCRN